MAEKENSELHPDSGIPKQTQSGENNRKKRLGSSPKSFWSRLTDPQAAVIAAVIAALLSLVGAAVSIWNTFYASNQSKDLASHTARLEKDLGDHTARLERIYKRDDTTIKAFQEATASIGNMKNAIQMVTKNPGVTLEEADKILEDATKRLNTTFDDYKSDVFGSDSNLFQVFHDAKNFGQDALGKIKTRRKAQPGPSQLSKETVDDLTFFFGKLKDAEKQMLEKYKSLTTT